MIRGTFWSYCVITSINVTSRKMHRATSVSCLKKKQRKWNMEMHFPVLFHDGLHCWQAYNNLEIRNTRTKIGIRPGGKNSSTHKISPKWTPIMTDRTPFQVISQRPYVIQASTHNYLSNKVLIYWNPHSATCFGYVKPSSSCAQLNGKGKAIPIQAWTGPEGSRRLRLPDFKTIDTWSW